jgi:4-amino-4-deoxy-L-arabinose transferase-like glycosyltransferase
MHYAVLAVPVSAFELAHRFSILPIFGLEAHTAMLVVMRGVSVVMGLGALVGASLCGVEMFGARRGVAGAAVLLLTPLFVYYGKTANLDVPSLCYFAWAVLALLRILRHNRRRDYVMLGVAAAASVATKDQMYASVVLLPLVPLVAAVRDQAARGWRRLAAGLVDARLLSGAAAAIVAFAVFHNMPFNFSGFLAHMKVLYTFPSLALVPRTAAGYWELTTRTIELFRFSLGWPLFVLAVAGIAGAVSRRDRRWWLWLLLVPLSSHLTFTWVALYVNDRYLFGGVFVLALFAGAAAADLVDAGRWRAAARAVVFVSLAWSLLYAASVNAMMTRDARAVARRWVLARAGIETAVGAVGWYGPSFPPPVRTARLETPGDVRTQRPEFVVVNERFAGRLENERPSGWQHAITGLRDGSLGYREAFRCRSPIPAWAVLQYEAPFRPGETSDLTNLDKINPETVVYERVGG